MADPLVIPRRPLGSTGLSVGVLGLGTVKIGRNEGVKYPGGGGFRLPSDAEVGALLDAALALGVTLLDTSPAYGTSEERLGALLGARRDRFVLVTKAGEEFEGGASRWDFSAAAIEASVARSLRRLRTDRVDGVLLHCGRNDFEQLSTAPAIGTLETLKRRGDLRFFGASTYTVEAGLLAAERCDVVMVEPEEAQAPVLARAAALGRGVLVKKPLRSGHAPPTAELFRKALSGPAVAAVVVGTLSPAHLAENARLIEGIRQ